MKYRFAQVFIVVFIFTAISIHTSAQDAQQDEKAPEALPAVPPINPRFIIGLTGGLSVPVGNYAKSDYFNSNSGFAGSGGNFGITSTYFFNKQWGVAELFSYRQESFVAGNIQPGMVAYPGGYGADTAVFTLKGSSHQFSFLIGPVYTLHVGKRTNVDFRVLVGFIDATLAGNSITLTEMGASQQFSQAIASANAFGMDAGVALRHSFTPKIGAGINADFSASKPDFSISNVNRTTTAGREITRYNQTLQTIDANLSVYYMIDYR